MARIARPAARVLVCLHCQHAPQHLQGTLLLPVCAARGWPVGITCVGRTAAARALLAFRERVCICVACILLISADCVCREVKVGLGLPCERIEARCGLKQRLEKTLQGRGRGRAMQFAQCRARSPNKYANPLVTPKQQRLLQYVHDIQSFIPGLAWAPASLGWNAGIIISRTVPKAGPPRPGKVASAHPTYSIVLLCQQQQVRVWQGSSATQRQAAAHCNLSQHPVHIPSARHVMWLSAKVLVSAILCKQAMQQ